MSNQNCPVCGSRTTYYNKSSLDFIEVICTRCSKFKISTTILDSLNSSDNQSIAKLSGYIFNQNQTINNPPIINSEFIDKVFPFISMPTFEQRSDFLFKYIAKKTKSLGSKVELDIHELIALTYSINFEEVDVISDFLKNKGYLEEASLSSVDLKFYSKISPNGHIYLDSLQKVNTTSKQAFVAMWFDESMSEIYTQGFSIGIEKSGYKPFRIDEKKHNNKICDEIIAEIKQSRFIVADFTGQRGGVYFEAGYAFGLGIPVIWTCKEGESELHFDIRQYNCIFWKTEEDLANKLQYAIEAVIGKG